MRFGIFFSSPRDVPRFLLLAALASAAAAHAAPAGCTREQLARCRITKHECNRWQRVHNEPCVAQRVECLRACGIP
jgi:hypothetical protein